MMTEHANRDPMGPCTPALRTGALEPPVRLKTMALTALLLAGSALVAPQVAEARSNHSARAGVVRVAHASPVRGARTAVRGTRSARAARHAGRNHHATHSRSRHSNLETAAYVPPTLSSNAAYIPVAIASAMPAARAFQGSPRAACLEATRRAEQVHNIPTGLLTAIALSESGLHAYAMNIGGRAVFPETAEAAASLLRAAGGRSVMAGCLQVNARVHARGETWPLDARLSADWGGAMLAGWGHQMGWAEALRRWHGGSHAAVPRLVCRVRAKMDVTQPGSALFDEYNCNGTREDRTRRNGAAHFTTATIETL